MRWAARAALPYTDGTIAAGTILQEISRSALSDTDRRHLDKLRKRERDQRKPRSIPVKWRGKLRLISVADLVVPRVLVIDTETTGVSKLSVVIEIALVVVENGAIVDARDVLVRAPKSVLQGRAWKASSAVHGISREAILSAPSREGVGHRLGRWYDSLGRPPCVAWPTAFDARLCAQTWPGLKLYWPKDLCIKRLWSRVVGGRAPKLEIAAAQLGVRSPEGQAHRARFDAILAADVMLALQARQAGAVLTPAPMSARAAAAEQRIQAAMEVG